MDVDLRQLEYFVAVAKALHFTRAAATVHVAQPSLSKQIRSLERELGAPLLNRARGNVTLTAAGETLLPLATRILADVDSARVQVQELVGLVRGQLRLGATPTLSTVLLPAALRRFCARYPGIEIHVEECGGRDLVRLLAGGQLDLALVALPLHTRDPALATVPLFREALVVAAPADGSIVRARWLRVRDLARYPLVMLRNGYEMREVVLAALRRERIEPQVAIEGGELDAVLSFVEAGLGIAVVPSMVVEGAPALRAIPFAHPGLTRTVGIAHRRDVEPSATARAFRSELLDHLADRARSGALPRDVEIIPQGTSGTSAVPGSSSA
jgi:DNA-binding transcriptional LysR family regulator